MKRLATPIRVILISFAAVTVAPAQSPPADDRRIDVRIVDDASGEPIASAVVRLAIYGKPGQQIEMRTEITDPKGKLTINKLPAGNFGVIGFWENLASRTKLYKGVDVKPGDESIELRMKRAPALRVRVVDTSTQEPLTGASVHLRGTDGERDHVTTDDGKVLIRGLAPGPLQVEVLAPGFAAKEETVEIVGTDTAGVTVALEPGLAVAGVVKDEQGQPVEGVSIFKRPIDPSRDVFLPFSQRFRNAKTDKEGKYLIDNLRAEKFYLSASKRGFIGQDITVVPDVAQNDTQVHDFTLSVPPPGRAVAGTIVDADGKPVAGAKVINGQGSLLHETTTDDNGHYRIENSSRGFVGFTLLVTAPGFAPKVVKFVPGSAEVPAKVDVTLAEGHRLRGQVVDEDGAPIPEVYVKRSDEYIQFGGRIKSTVFTDSEGRFQFDDLPERVTFDIRKMGFSSLDGKRLPLDGAEEVLVTLELDRELEGILQGGRVVDALSGAPVTAFDVQAIDWLEEKGSFSIGVSGQTVRSSEGEFRQEIFPEDKSSQIRIEAEGYQRGFLQKVVARPEGESELVEVRLQPIDKSQLQSFAGEVVDAAGRGIGGVELRLIVSVARRESPRDKFPFNWQMIREGRVDDVAELNQFLTAMTDQEGRFKFSEVQPAVDIELAYWGDGIAPGRQAGLEKIEPDERQQMRIVAAATGRVTGRIDRQQFPTCDRIVLKSAEETFWGELSDNGSAYEIANVPAGTYELQAIQLIAGDNPPGRMTSEIIHREQVEVKSGTPTVVDLGEK